MNDDDLGGTYRELVDTCGDSADDDAASVDDDKNAVKICGGKWVWDRGEFREFFRLMLPTLFAFVGSIFNSLIITITLFNISLCLRIGVSHGHESYRFSVHGTPSKRR